MQKNEQPLISIQPYFVMGTTDFCQRIFIENGISHFFSFSNKSGNDLTVSLIVDGCSNLIFEYKDRSVRTHLIGSTVEKRTFSVKKDAEYFGVRLQPSVTKFVKEYSPKEIIGKIIILDELESTKEFCRKMGEQKDFDSRIQLFLKEYSKFQSENKSTKADLFKQISDIIIKRKGIIKVSELENLSGYSSRYLNKIFDSELGMSTKQLCNSVKFQFLLGDLNNHNMENLTSIASEYNFYDQAHFIHEFKEFTGKTPKEYTNEVEQNRYSEHIINK
ncbi:MAG: helix-turn-helix domain-containing protein [Treponema sp.]|nr:helix-turn-helix domain-containing protein [Treponema sp.]